MHGNERVIAILLRLLNGERLSASALHEEYEVSQRSIERDFPIIDRQLEELDWPLRVAHTKGAKYYDLVNHDPHHFAMVLAVIKIVIASRALPTTELREVVTALTRLLPPLERGPLDKLITNGLEKYVPVGRFDHHDPFEVPENSQLLTKIMTISELIVQKVPVVCEYQHSTAPGLHRLVSLPTELYFADRYFYVVMYDVDRDQSSVYRLDRIMKLAAAQGKRVRLKYSEKIDAGNLQNHAYLLTGGQPQTIRFQYWAFPHSALDRFPTAKIINNHPAGGGVIIQMEALEQGVLMWVLEQGAWIKVLAPQSLITRLKAELAKVQGYYQ